MSVLAVSRSDASFGYGSGGSIFQIDDPLPVGYWDHPAHAWSPLIRTAIPGLDGVWLKYEGSHLSGSFKDRIMAVSIAEMLARDPDCPGMVVPSSGNAAVSAAVLCARRSLAMVAIVPISVPVERLRPILARGGIVVRAGEGPSQSYALAGCIPPLRRHGRNGVVDHWGENWPFNCRAESRKSCLPSAPGRS